MPKTRGVFSKSRFQDVSGVSRETTDQLSIYISLLSAWQKRMNLVSTSSMKDVWLRHVLDSAQLFTHLKRRGGTTLDLGSGAGFPGLVLSIMGVSGLVLVESNKKKCKFLEKVVFETGCEAKIYNGRIESFSLEQNVSCVIARALAPLEKLLNYSYPHISSTGVCFFLKGHNYQQELTQAKKSWNMSVVKHFSIDNPMINGAGLAADKAPGVLLEIRELLPSDKK